MENPYFEKLADFSCVMWICGGFAPRGPSALLATKNASFGIKTCHLAIPRIMGQKIVLCTAQSIVWAVRTTTTHIRAKSGTPKQG
jgi:hypothetical protein